MVFEICLPWKRCLKVWEAIFELPYQYSLVLHCSNFLSYDCLSLVHCSMVFFNCIDLHVSVLLHTFVLPLRLELKSKAQDLTQGKRSRFFMKIREVHVLFLGKNQGNSWGGNVNPKHSHKKNHDIKRDFS